jgi:hypothetical protein
MVDLRLVADVINPEADLMGHTPAFDHRLALGAIEGKAHGDDGFERVALGTPGR